MFLVWHEASVDAAWLMNFNRFYCSPAMCKGLVIPSTLAAKMFFLRVVVGMYDASYSCEFIYFQSDFKCVLMKTVCGVYH